MCRDFSLALIPNRVVRSHKPRVAGSGPDENQFLIDIQKHRAKPSQGVCPGRYLGEISNGVFHDYSDYSLLLWLMVDDCLDYSLPCSILK